MQKIKNTLIYILIIISFFSYLWAKNLDGDGMKYKESYDYMNKRDPF